MWPILSLTPTSAMSESVQLSNTPTSEVGYERATETYTNVGDDKQWRKLFEKQNDNLRADSSLTSAWFKETNNTLFVYDHYWFESMRRKVAKLHSGRVQAELHPIPKVESPWHTVHIDTTGKLSGNILLEGVPVCIDRRLN